MARLAGKTKRFAKILLYVLIIAPLAYLVAVLPFDLFHRDIGNAVTLPPQVHADVGGAGDGGGGGGGACCGGTGGGTAGGGTGGDGGAGDGGSASGI